MNHGIISYYNYNPKIYWIPNNGAIGLKSFTLENANA